MSVDSVAHLLQAHGKHWGQAQVTHLLAYKYGWTFLSLPRAASGNMGV
jgi:hypothetical protein